MTPIWAIDPRRRRSSPQRLGGRHEAPMPVSRDGEGRPPACQASIQRDQGGRDACGAPMPASEGDDPGPTLPTHRDLGGLAVAVSLAAGGTPTGQTARIAGSAFHARTGLPLGARDGLQPAFADPPAAVWQGRHGIPGHEDGAGDLRDGVRLSGARRGRAGVTANLLKPHNSYMRVADEGSTIPRLASRRPSQAAHLPMPRCGSQLGPPSPGAL